MFKGGTYDASAFQTGFQACLASNTNFSNFAFQVQVKSITGDAAVVYFRNTILNQVIQGYRFSISTSSSYKLDLTLNATQGRVLQVGISPAIHTQQGQTNEITIIAKGSAIYVYVNQQYITSVSDSTFSSGAIGLGAGYLTTPTEVTFSNARVWVL